MDVNYNFSDARKHKTSCYLIQISFLLLPVKADTEQKNVINSKAEITSTTDNVRITELNTDIHFTSKVLFILHSESHRMVKNKEND